MQSPYIVELTEQNFREVLEGSVNTPVLLHFFASVSQESVDLIPAVQTLTQDYDCALTLALVDCEKQQAIAAQFGIQALPTIALFINGQPVDGLGGPQPIEAVEQMLAKHLPSKDELSVQKAAQLIKNDQHAEAFIVLNGLSEERAAKGDVKLAKADCLLEAQQFDQAQELLNHIPLEYQDNEYKRLMAKLELHLQAADSPEIQALEEQFSAQPQDIKLACDLALQYHQVQRDEEALALLWQFLSKDLNALDGDVKKAFMDILSALGQGHPIAGQYRRQLYSILY
ncbi:co-chaperone YbbN [Vibrio sp. FNV 38]|nr:co-chaperone YbbN [Vibrio sp. FNV 38]